MINVFTIALLTAGFGKVWAKLGLQKSCTTLEEIARLHNCAVTVCSKLPDMRPLENITPQLWHDVTPQQREWQNQLITYYATKMDSTVRWDQQSTLG